MEKGQERQYVKYKSNNKIINNEDFPSLSGWMIWGNKFGVLNESFGGGFRVGIGIGIGWGVGKE